MSAWMRMIVVSCIAAAALAITPTAHAAIVTDTFTGSDGTLLQNHVGEVGATWVQFPGFDSDFTLTNGRIWGRAGSDPTNVDAVYTASGTPPTNEYNVLADLYATLPGDGYNDGMTGVVARADAASQSFYWARLYNYRWRIGKCLPSPNYCTELATSGVVTVTPGQTYGMRFEVRNAAKKLYVDGVLMASTTDNSLTATGRAGVTQAQSDASPSTKFNLDNFSVNGGPPAYTVTFQDSFEGGTFPQVFATGAWNSGKLFAGSGMYFNQITPSGYSAVDGTKVADSGLTANSQRSEIQCHRDSSYAGGGNLCAGGLGSEFFYEWSFRIPSTVAIPDQPHDRRPNLMQTKPEQGADPSCYGGGMVVRRHPTDSTKFELRQSIRGGTITDPNGGCTFQAADTTYFLGSFDKGAWHRVVLHAKWAATTSGFEEMWIDGTQVMPMQSRPTAPTTLTKQDFRLGLYNSINNAAWNVQYDHVKIGVP